MLLIGEINNHHHPIIKFFPAQKMSDAWLVFSYCVIVFLQTLGIGYLFYCGFRRCCFHSSKLTPSPSPSPSFSSLQHSRKLSLLSSPFTSPSTPPSLLALTSLKSHHAEQCAHLYQPMSVETLIELVNEWQVRTVEDSSTHCVFRFKFHQVPLSNQCHLIHWNAVFHASQKMAVFLQCMVTFVLSDEVDVVVQRSIADSIAVDLSVLSAMFMRDYLCFDKHSSILNSGYISVSTMHLHHIAEVRLFLEWRRRIDAIATINYVSQHIHSKSSFRNPLMFGVMIKRSSQNVISIVHVPTFDIETSFQCNTVSDHDPFYVIKWEECLLQ